MKPIICIPSYHRPDAVGIERLKNVRGLDKYLFIRPEDLDNYSKHKKRLQHYSLEKR